MQFLKFIEKMVVIVLSVLQVKISKSIESLQETPYSVQIRINLFEELLQ